MQALFKKISLFFFSFFLSVIVVAQTATVLEINTPIYNSTADYIESAFNQAQEKNASFIILKINTPGGLLSATRRISGTIMESSVPVVSFITPGGAHAGSAGAFIALSAHVVAMSSGTNMGAAHPVLISAQPDSIMNRKMTEGAMAFMRSIAEKRGRDTTLILQMVAQSKAVTAQEALDAGIIDFIAENNQELLQKINQYKVTLNTNTEHVLKTDGVELDAIPMGFKDKFLNTLSNPDVMYLLLLLGVMGLLFELFNPGGLVPGIVGAICLLLAGYGMSVLPVDYMGLAFILLAIVLFLLELKFASYAILTIAGVVSLGFGAVFLIKQDPSLDVVKISWSVIIISVILTTLFFVFLVGIGLKAQKKKSKVGLAALEGVRGVAMEDLNPEGRVRVNGELWNAVSESQDLILKDSEIEVISIKDFKLTVKPITLTT